MFDDVVVIFYYNIGVDYFKEYYIDMGCLIIIVCDGLIFCKFYG